MNEILLPKKSLRLLLLLILALMFSLHKLVELRIPFIVHLRVQLSIHQL